MDAPELRAKSEKKARITYSRIKRQVLRHVFLIRVILILLIVGFIGLFGFGISKFSENAGLGNIFTLASNFISAPVNQIASENGRTNILVMGKAGGSHDGPDLTDTMILVSISFSKPSITLISLPRDLWIAEIRAKINSAYYWGNQNTPYFDNSKNSGGGIAFAKSIAEEVVGQKIQYGAVIDFSAFKDIIDALGGINVMVDRSFTDNLYPIAGRENDLCGGDPAFACRYQTVSFSAGTQQMNGDTALIFVRSRHAEGDEGTDIAREARQQKVIDAIKSKIGSPRVFLSPKVDLALFSVFKKYVQTDIDMPTMAILGRLAVNAGKNINQYLIPDDLLVNPPISKKYDQLYVFVPKSGNWGDINDWFKKILN